MHNQLKGSFALVVSSDRNRQHIVTVSVQISVIMLPKIYLGSIDIVNPHIIERKLIIDEILWNLMYGPMAANSKMWPQILENP